MVNYLQFYLIRYCSELQYFVNALHNNLLIFAANCVTD